MSDRILCVDDDPNILQAYQRSLRKRFRLETALGGEEALERIAARGPFAVVVADMRMPGMNGVELLARIKEIAPLTVRMMLTGNADQQTAMEAVNEGHIFRFLTKPCPPETFAKVLQAGLEQYRLVTAERELLSDTLGAAVKVVADILAMMKPQAFGRASQVRPLVRQLCQAMRAEKGWAIEIAATLSQIGCITVPEKTLEKVYRGDELSPAEQAQFQKHAKVGHELIRSIPRLEEIAEVIGYQEKHYDGSGFPQDYRSGEEIPLGSRILRLALDWTTLGDSGLPPEMAMAFVRDRQGWYDPKVVEALKAVMDIRDDQIVKQVRVNDLADGTVLADDVRSIQGTLLCAKGQEVNPAVRYRLRNYLVNVGIAGPVKVFVHTQEDAGVEDGAADGEPAEDRDWSTETA